MSSKSGGKVHNKNYGRLSLRPLDNAGSKSGSKKKKRKLQPLRQSKDRSSDDEYMMESEAVSESHPEEDSGSEEAGGASDTTNQNKNLSISGQKAMVAMFVTLCVVASGLSGYLTSALGGGKTTQFVNKFTKQVLNLINSTKEALDGTGLNMVDDKVFVGEVWSTALTIATSDMTSIADHLDKLKTQGLKDSTLRGHVGTYKLFFYWFSYVFKGRNQYPVDAENKKMLEVVFSNLSRFYGKAYKVVRRKERQSIEEKVALKSWPEGGFEDLQMCLIPHIKALLAMDPAKIRVDEESYRHFKQVLVSGLYAFSVQGRIGGVKSILLRQAEDLIENGKRRKIKYREPTEESNVYYHHIQGFANSDMFKTVGTMEAQPVILGTADMQEVVRLYIDVVRPLVALEDENQATAMLFLNLDGTPDTNLGRHVSAYFLKHLSINIDTNTIRKIAETTAADLFRRGLLNEAQVAGCNFVNGHGGLTADDYYVQ